MKRRRERACKTHTEHPPHLLLRVWKLRVEAVPLPTPPIPHHAGAEMPLELPGHG